MGGFTEEISCSAHRRFPLVRWPPTTQKLSLFITLALIHPIFCHIPLSPNLPPNITLGGCDPRKLGHAVTETLLVAMEMRARVSLQEHPEDPATVSLSPPREWVRAPAAGEPQFLSYLLTQYPTLTLAFWQRLNR